MEKWSRNVQRRWVLAIDIQGRSQDLHHFCPGMDSNWGSSSFSCRPNQNNSGLSGVYVTYMYCGLRVIINVHEKIMNAFVLHLFLRMKSAESQRPPIWAPWLTTPLHRAVYEVYLWVQVNSVCEKFCSRLLVEWCYNKMRVYSLLDTEIFCNVGLTEC